MNKEQKLGLLKCIGYIGFHDTFDGMAIDMIEDENLAKLVSKYLGAYKALAEYVGFPDDLELLEKETIM